MCKPPQSPDDSFPRPQPTLHEDAHSYHQKTRLIHITHTDFIRKNHRVDAFSTLEQINTTTVNFFHQAYVAQITQMVLPAARNTMGCSSSFMDFFSSKEQISVKRIVSSHPMETHKPSDSTAPLQLPL